MHITLSSRLSGASISFTAGCTDSSAANTVASAVSKYQLNSRLFSLTLIYNCPARLKLDSTSGMLPMRSIASRRILLPVVKFAAGHKELSF